MLNKIQVDSIYYYNQAKQGKGDETSPPEPLSVLHRRYRSTATNVRIPKHTHYIIRFFRSMRCRTGDPNFRQARPKAAELVVLRNDPGFPVRRLCEIPPVAISTTKITNKK